MTAKQSRLKTKEIFAAAKRYKTNCAKQKEILWDKDADVQNVFVAMKNAGFKYISATSGTFMADKPDGKIFVVTADESVERVKMKTYKTFQDWFKDSILKG